MTLPEGYLALAQQAIDQRPKGLFKGGWYAEEGAVGTDSFDAHAVSTAIAWICMGNVRWLKRPQTSSYSLKHSAERWGKALGLAPYIANGELILAARTLAIPMSPRPIGESPNCLIGLRDEMTEERRMGLSRAIW